MWGKKRCNSLIQLDNRGQRSFSDTYRYTRNLTSGCCSWTNCHNWSWNPKRAMFHNIKFYVTLSPIIMEVENHPKWKETILLEGPIFHFHDYGRKGKSIICISIKASVANIGPLLKLQAWSSLWQVWGVNTSTSVRYNMVQPYSNA